MAEASTVPSRRRRWRRRILLALAFVLVVAIAVRILLTLFAADLFVAALRHALAGSGAEVVFAEPPAVSLEGFEAKGVVLRSLDGQEWVRADEASGSANLRMRPPYVSVALVLTNAHATVAASKRGRAAGDPASSPLDASLPPSISGIALERATIDLGEGRTIAIDASLSRGEGGATRVAIEKLDYSVPSGETAAEKIAGELTFSPAAGGQPKLDVAIAAGAVLAGSVLLDFDAHPFTFAGRFDDSDGRWSFADATFSFGKLVGGGGSFAISEGSIVSADVRLASEDLEPAFATLVREPFSGVVPALSGSELRGKGEMKLELRAPSRHRTNATVTLTLSSFRTRALEADGLAIDLPWMGSALGRQPVRSGRIRATRLSILGLPWTGVDVPIEASAGRLSSKSVQVWKSSGGTMRVSGLAYHDDPEKGPRASGDVTLEGFDLASLGALSGWKGFAGTLRGNLGRVEIDSDSARAQGSVELEAWKGTVTLSRLTVEKPFGRVPELGLDASVREIDLESLTTAFGLGRVSGVLEGNVTGLVVADGQPQAFDADLHTVERRGVSQTIDVRAISQLGALGGDTGSLTGSLLKVIDRYRYSAMGIRCRLRNDVFEIRGVRSNGGRDYLVKGSLLPPSVSVVSHSQVISFSEMLRRIERISALGEGGPANAQP